MVDGPKITPNLSANVAWLYDWLVKNDHAVNLPKSEAEMFRILKVAEELGEVAQALIGARGQNPRKGHTHIRQDVADELCDVALTALVALNDYEKDPVSYFVQFVMRNRARAEMSVK